MSDEMLHMWESQKLFNRNFVDFDLLDLNKRQEMTKEYTLHLISEVTSLLEAVNWKMHHKKNSVKVNREDLVLEIIDVWKYLLSICLLWDISPEEFYKAYFEKSGLVEQRYLQEFAETKDRKIVICDIDGVLSDYPKNFLNYVKKQEGDKITAETAEYFKESNVTEIDLYTYLRGIVPQDSLKKYKHLYRSQGFTRDEEVIEGSREFLESLHRKGYYVVLLTSRPFEKYKSLYLDTFVWLSEKGFVYDMLLNDSKKRDKVSELLETSQVEFVIDDDPRLIRNLASIDSLKKIYIFDKPYNQDIKESDKVVRISHFGEIPEVKEGVSQ